MRRRFDAEAHKKLVSEAFSRTSRPILVGPVSMLQGWHATMAETETLLEDMVAEGSLRRVTEAEKKRFGVREGYFPVYKD